MYKYLFVSAILGVAALLTCTNSVQAQKGGGKGGGGGGGKGGGGGGGKGGAGAVRPAPAPARPGNVPNQGYYGGGGYYRGPGIGIGIGIGGFYPAYGYAYDPYYAPRYAYYPPSVIVQQPAPEAPVSNAASIRVLVPDPDAKVWFDGNPTKQTGTDRFFHTPELLPGSTYSYRLRAEWMQKGQRMVQEQVVSVAPGRTSLADFTQPFSEEVPPPPAK